MLARYSLAPLGSEQVLLALPLAQVWDKTLSAERWQMFNRTIASASHATAKTPAGVMGLRSANGYFIGLLTYDVQLTLRHGRTRSISELVLTRDFTLARWRLSGED